MNLDTERTEQALKNARQAYQRGEHREARYWAELAVKLAPGQEEPWLWLAVVASPHASVEYLKRALEINPHSKRARHGMHWAIQRLRANKSQPRIHRILVDRSIPSDRLISRRSALIRPFSFGAALVLLIALFIIWFGSSSFTTLETVAFNGNPNRPLAQVGLTKNTRTPTPTATPTPTPTFTPTLTPTNTPTPLPTETPTEAPTDTLIPTQAENPPEQPPPQPEIPNLPSGVGEHDRWVDVNLSHQTTYAYEGTNLIRSFLVSTGTWLHPTITGEFNIYVKYVYADMAGPGYYLPDVPYVMYFYKGYGLHGTYWHHNFGTPMSHGCINLTIEDAGWLFDWSSIGSVVNIHY